MAKGARVLSVSELAAFRAFLIKFAEGVRHGVSVADGDVQKTVRWLRDEHPTRLLGERRRAQRAVEVAIEDLRRKRLQPTATGDPQSVVIEQKALAKAKAKLEWLDQKIAATKRWASHFDKEANQYQGATQAARSLPDSTLPRALGRLDAHLTAIEDYLKMQSTADPIVEPSEPGGDTVSRGSAPSAETDPQAEETPPLPDDPDTSADDLADNAFTDPTTPEPESNV